MSLDEAYLDITHLVRPDLPASTIANYIRRDIYEVTRLTASAGVSYNKFLAKLASGMNKPNGLTVIDYNNVHEILMQLDIEIFQGRQSFEEKCINIIYIQVKIYIIKMNLN